MGTNSRKEKSEVCLDLDWPSHGSTYGNENTPLAPSESRSQKSADGRMATGAGLVEWEQNHGKKKAKYVLTSTGLLMEGLVDRALHDSRRRPHPYWTSKICNANFASG